MKGQELGLVGTVGNASAPHLHVPVSGRPDLLTANSPPFVFDEWPLTGVAERDTSWPEVPVPSRPGLLGKALLLNLDMSNFLGAASCSSHQARWSRAAGLPRSGGDRCPRPGSPGTNGSFENMDGRTLDA
jgi:murein DD-endopeptidase MepM/ murein hydrolase activator NlpD